MEYYNLDVIISVGYRVKSQRGTQFRIWANRILKDYLIKGYAIKTNAKAEQLDDLKQTVKLLSNVIRSKELTADEATDLNLLFSCSTQKPPISTTIFQSRFEKDRWLA